MKCSSENKLALHISFQKQYTNKPGAAEQVKQVKQLLHRNSEVLLQRNFQHLGFMKGEIFRASCK